MPHEPRPSWLLILNSLAVIAACMALFGYCLWGIATQHNPLFIFGGPLMLLVPLLIAAMQYRAVFRRSENAARHVGNYLFIAGGLLSIFFAMMAYLYVAKEKAIDYHGLAFLCTLILAGGYLLFCGRTNQRWAKELEQWEAENAL